LNIRAGQAGISNRIAVGPFLPLPDFIRLFAQNDGFSPACPFEVDRQEPEHVAKSAFRPHVSSKATDKMQEPGHPSNSNAVLLSNLPSIKKKKSLDKNAEFARVNCQKEH
jgi:hypothetical protein